MARTLATIGYEHATQADVIGRLKDAGVEVVIDVRAVPSSRRAGFSKNILAASLHEAGIDYVHLKALGTPKAGRDAAHKGHVAQMLAIYHEHLEDPQAQLQLAEATDIARDRKAALLCYEADAAGCHRRVVADLIRDKVGLTVVDL
jgi:uncharacterized protein (DUF488 family)